MFVWLVGFPLESFLLAGFQHSFEFDMNLVSQPKEKGLQGQGVMHCSQRGGVGEVRTCPKAWAHKLNRLVLRIAKLSHLVYYDLDCNLSFLKPR